MSTKNQKTLAKIIAALETTPGQHVWSIAEMIGAKHGDGDRNLGDDLVRRTLRAAEQRGEVVSVKSGSRRLWFVSTK